MATQYFVVLTQWAIGQAPQNVGTRPPGAPVTEMQQIVCNKGWEMIQANKMVRADCPTKNDSLAHLDGKFTDGTTFHPIIPSNLAVSYGRAWFNNARTHILEAIKEGAKGHSGNSLPEEYDDPELTPKSLRIFTSEEAATEWNDFMLSLGAQFSITLTQEEIDALDVLPDDSVIAQYIGVPA